MDTLGVAKPNISFAVHQLSLLKRVDIIGFRNSRGRLVRVDIEASLLEGASRSGLSSDETQTLLFRSRNCWESFVSTG